MLKVEVDTYLKTVAFSCPACCLLIIYDADITNSPLDCPYCKVRILPPVTELMASRLIRMAFYKQAFTEGVLYGCPPKSEKEGK